MNNCENKISLNARMLLLVSSILFAAMPVSIIMLYKFISIVPKMYFVIFTCIVPLAFAACAVLSALASSITRKGLLNSAYIVFFSAIGLYSVFMIAVMIISLIFM